MDDERERGSGRKQTRIVFVSLLMTSLFFQIFVFYGLPGG